MAELNDAERGLLAEWLEVAEDDTAIALLLHEHPARYRGLAYHAQQAVEKYLKGALLLLKQTALPTPDMGALLDLLNDVLAFSDEEYRMIRRLNLLSMRYRYPQGTPPESLDRDEVLGILTHFRSRLFPLLHAALR